MPKRNTALRDKNRKRIARGKPPCHICGGNIDYNLPHTHPQSYALDHIVPLARGGTDDLSNLAAAHRFCNESKGARMPATTTSQQQQRGRYYRTSRTW
ncbi:HNH endonuclease [Gordonia paraffinivorans]|uniref:HNH endonuclease n=1 Tax=Gordonia paraffinivorans TaxID=175628 RepID=UPI00144557C8|nr:HNH endonuclease signature motif containing protein [Gordonia paraffinivorans]MCD2145022.1 HNH endonuclease [Gordonia paraffinivorans]